MSAQKLSRPSERLDQQANRTNIWEQPPSAFRVSFTDLADQGLAGIHDAATREVVIRRALELRHEPLRQGKPLAGDLKTYRSVRAAGQRYRVVYQVAVSAGAVVVLVVGIRKEGDRRDVYRVAQKGLTRGTIGRAP